MSPRKQTSGRTMRASPQSAIAGLRPPDTQVLDFGDLGALLGFHVRLAHLAIYRDWMATLKGCDLTQKQFTVLSLVDLNPGCSQAQVGIALGTDRATMMAVISRLEDRHLLVRARSRIDRRRQELFLTKTGRALLEDARKLIATHEERFTRLLSPTEQAEFLTLLQRISAVQPAEDVQGVEQEVAG